MRQPTVPEADPLVRIEQVTSPAEDSQAFLGFAVDAPVPGAVSPLYAFKVAGWVLGRDAPVTGLHVLHRGEELRIIPVNVPHPQPAERYPSLPGAAHCGFWNLVGVLGLPERFELELQARFQDGRMEPFARIVGRRTFLRTGFQPSLQPLLITSLGRMGTTFLMRLLSQHPAVVADQRYPYETRIAQYWVHMLGVLAEPANTVQSVTADTFRRDWHSVGHNPFYHGHLVDTPETGLWLGRVSVERLATLVQETVEGFYRRLAASQGRTGPRYFAEKYLPGRILPLTHELYPEAREIVLVRDFRDMLCSVLAFNKKRGFQAFGRERVDTDEEYVGIMRKDGADLYRYWQDRAGAARLVRYEDLVQRPLEVLREILTYLELDGDLEAAESMLAAAAAETPELRNHRTAPDAASSIGRWRRDLSPALQAACRRELGDLLEAFGYRW